MSTGKKVMRIDEPISSLKITSSYLDQVFDRRREQWSLLNQYCACQGKLINCRHMAFVIITVLTQVFWFHSVVWLSHQHVLYRHASGIGSGVQHWRALNRGPGCRIRFGCTHSPLPPGGVFAVDLCGNLKKKSWLLNVATHLVPLPGRLGSGWEKFLFKKTIQEGSHCIRLCTL